MSVIAAGQNEYCKWDTFRPQCGDHEVVLVQSALYGRMRHGTCITGETHLQEACPRTNHKSSA